MIAAGILLIMLDDVNQADIDIAITPNIDALARESMVYRYHHGEAACSVSRVTLHSGLCPSIHLVGSVYNQNNNQGEGFSPEYYNDLPTIIKSTDSIFLGKYHAADWNNLYHATYTAGFDEFIGTMGNLSGEDNYYRISEYDSNIGSQYVVEGEYATARYCSMAHDALGVKDFIYLSLHAAHKPYSDQNWPPAISYTTQEDIKTAMIEAVDYYLAPVIQKAINLGYVIVFTSDNGGNKYDGEKGNLLESTLRVPMYIRDPEGLGVGHCDEMTNWSSLRNYLYTGDMHTHSVMYHEFFKSIGYVDYSSYTRSIQTKYFKLIIDPDKSEHIFAIVNGIDVPVVVAASITNRLKQLMFSLK